MHVEHSKADCSQPADITTPPPFPPSPSGAPFIDHYSELVLVVSKIFFH